MRKGFALAVADGSLTTLSHEQFNTKGAKRSAVGEVARLAHDLDEAVSVARLVRLQKSKLQLALLAADHRALPHQLQVEVWAESAAL